MDSGNPGRKFSPQNQGPSGQQSRFRYGIHFSNTPDDIRRANLEELFNVFGECILKMDPGARHGWVGYDSIDECNFAFASMNPNSLGMYIHKGPYEAGPMLRPPTGGPPRGRPPMGGPPMGRPSMGGPPMGRPSMGGPPMGRPSMGGPPIGRLPMGGPTPLMSIPTMGGQYPRNYGQMSGVPRPRMRFYEDELYDYYADPYEAMGYGYDDYDNMCPEMPGCDVGPCTTCNARTSYSCERCGAFYCSEICQRHDWNQHRELCDRNIPTLNYGPRHRPGSGDIQEERLQRLAISDEREVPTSRPSSATQEGRSPKKPNDGDRRPADDASSDRRSDSAANRGDDSAERRRRNDDQERRDENGCGSRRGDGESKPTGDRRNENGFGDRRGDGDRRPTGERRNDGGYGDRRGDGDRRPTGDHRNEGGFDDRRRDGDRRPTGDRRNDGGFDDRRGDGDRRPTGDRRNDGDRRPTGDRRNDGGFDDRRGDGDRRPTGDRRNDGGFDDLRGDGDRRPIGDRRNDGGFGDRRGDGDRRPTGDRRNDGGFGDRRGDGDRRPTGDRNEGGLGDRRGGGDKRPMGERRNENGFGDRNENGFGDRRSVGDRRNDNTFGDRRQSGYQNRDKKSEDGPEASFENSKAECPKGAVPSENPLIAVAGSDIKTNVTLGSLLKKSSEGDVSQTKKSELVAEKGVCVNLKMNDAVVITNAMALDSIYVTPAPSALSDDFKKVIIGIALHCKDAPVLGHSPAPNEVVACQFTLDNDFYRAVVKEIISGGEYLMQFCDYGNVQKCKVDKLKAIPEELKKCPWNAVEVSLSGVGSKVPIAGPIQRLFMELTDNEVNLKLQFDGDISKGVVLVKPDGKSVNDEVNSLIGQAATPEKKGDPAPKISTPTPKVDIPVPKDDPPAPKISTPTPKVDIPAPKMDAPAPAKEPVVSVPSVNAPVRSPDQVLTSILRKANMPEPEPPATCPAEEGVCTQLQNDDTVVITASTGTGSTYITRIPESKEMIDVALKLNIHCKTAAPLGREPRPNEVIACQFVDSLYYRAVVSEVLPGGEYMVTFCDYGNSAKYKATDLKVVPNELKMLPRQGVKVYFRDVDPVPVTGKVGDILDKLSAEETQLKLRFSGSIENGVELIRPDGKSVNEELRAILAPSQKPANSSAAVEPEDLSPAASVPLPSDKPFKLMVFGILHEFLVAACNGESPEIAQFEQTYAPRIMEYCQKSRETEHRPAPGDMCLAKFEGEWYRALTMNAEEDGTFDVFFVDYGNTSKVKPSDIRKIPQDIRSPLHMLTLCTVVGLGNSPDVWPKIRARIEKDIEQHHVAMFDNVTAVIQTGSTAEVTIPELKGL